MGSRLEDYEIVGTAPWEVMPTASARLFEAHATHIRRVSTGDHIASYGVQSRIFYGRLSRSA
jgi:hypothetical protein